jgi:hypothetical protein
MNAQTPKCFLSPVMLVTFVWAESHLRFPAPLGLTILTALPPMTHFADFVQQGISAQKKA